MEVVIKLKHIGKSFGEKTLYTDLSIELNEGEVFALIGPNGVGKTTLMRLIMDWDLDYTGEIERKEGLCIGYSPEIPEFPQILKGREVLEYFMEVRGFNKKERVEKSKDLMEIVGLNLEKDTLVVNYSKGMKQRLAVAQALIGDPDLLLLDEPSAGLDFFGQIQMQKLIARLKERNKTIILNSHLLYDVEKVCDRGIIIMGNERYMGFNRDEFKEKSLEEMFLDFAKEENYVSAD